MRYASFFGIFVLFAPSLTSASVPTVVHGTLSLTAEHGSYQFSSLSVPEGSTLDIGEGVVITFESGAELRVAGGLRVHGTSTHPVILTSLDGEWQGITVDSSMAPTLSWFELHHARVPLTVRAPSLTLDHIAEIDCTSTRLVVTITRPTGVLRIHSLSTTVPQTAGSIGAYGVEVHGPVGEVVLQDITLPLYRFRHSDMPDIAVTGGYAGVQLIGVETRDHCFLQTVGSTHIQLLGFINPACTPKQPSLLFVPGFGSSMQYNVFRQATPRTPMQAGWRFTPFVSDADIAFTDLAAARHIPYAVAFYDWRQPPEQVVDDYLVPAIDALKARDATATVTIVAHSYGGLVASTYLSSDSYRGDVDSFITLGTPYAGSAKAYDPWEGGIFPSDWAFAQSLIRWYARQVPNNLSALSVLRSTIPSIRWLLPRYPVLTNHARYLTTFKNPFSAPLLTDRVRVWKTVGGTGTETLDRIPVDYPQPGIDLWPDGKPLPVPAWYTTEGDGTVSTASALATGAIPYVLPATHADIPAVVASSLLQELYPNALSVPPKHYTPTSLLLLSVDCPVDISVTLPNGEHVLSTNSADARVAASDDITWMFLPRSPGTYHMVATARADTTMRWWFDTDEPQSRSLQKGERATISYTLRNTEASPPSPTPSPSPTAPAFSDSLPRAALHISEGVFQTFNDSSFPAYSKVPIERQEDRRKGIVTGLGALVLATLLVVAKYLVRRPRSPNPP